MAAALVDELVQLSPDLIIHSDRKRTRIIAQRVADQLSVEIRSDHHWRERDFGDWEGRSWTNIYRETGNAMEGMLDDPDGFRPGGGETTNELVNRALAGWRGLPTGQNIVVIAHGGPIAAILADRADAAIRSLPDYIPHTGSITEIN